MIALVARARIVLALSLLPVFACAAEPEVSEREMPRFPAVEAKDAAKTLKLRPGFGVELAASEPNVASPVAVAFDEDSRMYVVEMIDYSERRDEKLGRIRLLEDADGDGVYEKSTVFAEGMGWPTAVACWKGGVFVGCSPDIWYMKDTDGDGRADEKRVVYTGFAAGAAKLNVQALLNSFNWGLDNRIHGATSNNGGKVENVEARNEKREGRPIELRGKGFAFDPRSGDFAAENGGGQHGLSFDDWGRMYVCSNSHHIQAFAYDARYAAGEYAMPAPLADVAVDGPAAEVFRASPEEPWRVIRTKWRVSGVSQGVVEGGGRSAGYFTGATGVTIYRGDAYGPDFTGDAFTGDAGGNLVHRKKIRPNGVLVKAQRAPDEQQSEFLASTDTWFRPVQFANAPDGCLYVIDMYRQTIEHPWSLPATLKKHLDLNAGNDRGRIWRVVPAGLLRRGPVKLGRARSEELVVLLAHPNGWHRDTAARLLYERQDRAVIPALERLAADRGTSRETTLGRLHALYALDGLGALNAGHTVRAMGDAEPRLRAHGVRLAEKFASDPDVVRNIDALARDPDLGVRYQVALTLGSVPAAEHVTALAAIYLKSPNDPWVEAAVLRGVGDKAIELFKKAYAAGAPAELRRLGPKLAERVGRGAYGEQMASVIEIAGERTDAKEMMAIARGLADGSRRAGVPFDVEKGAAIIDRAERLVRDETADTAARVAAIGVLGCTTWAHAADTLLPLVDPKRPQDVQAAAVAALDQLDAGEFAREMLARWSGLSPRVREAVAAAMVKRPARARALLDAIAAGAVRRGEISAAHAAALRQSTDKDVKAAAAKVFSAPAGGAREQVIRRFAAAVEMPGDAKRGRELYLAKCASCHRLGGDGNALGPDLETVKNAGRQTLLTNILDPNREVAPQFAAYVVETTDGDSQVGVIASETAAAVTLRMAYEMEVVVPRGEIKTMRSAGLSIMPEGLEDGMTPRDLADLMEHVMSGR